MAIFLQMDESKSVDYSGDGSPQGNGDDDDNITLQDSPRPSDTISSQPDNSFVELYDLSVYENERLSSTPLYDGAKTTVMDALVHYLSWFSEHPGISKEALSDILRMQHAEILPPGNKLPATYNEVMKLVEPFLVQPILFHACPNDCVVFRGRHTDLSACPTCGASRFTDQGAPAKRFTYLPIGPRLVRLFGTSNLSKLVQAHGSRCSEAGMMYDVHDSPSWSSAYSNAGLFASDVRGISFAFNTDGVNPYSHNRVSYSMWPIILTVLNFPIEIRYTFGNFWLVGTIPGNGTKEPNTLDPYLDILVDELLAISNKETFDAYQNAPFKLKADILMYVLDYPGLGKVFNVLGANAYQACAWCEIEGMFNLVYLQFYWIIHDTYPSYLQERTLLNCIKWYTWITDGTYLTPQI